MTDHAPLRWATTAFCLVALVAVASCRPPTHEPPPDEIRDARLLLRTVSEQRAALMGLVTESRIEYYARGSAQKGRAILAAHRPAALRVEVLSPTQDFLALLATDGERMVTFSRGDDGCFEGPSCAGNLARFIEVAIDPQALVRLLLGEPPVDADSFAATSVVFDRRSGLYVVTLEAADPRERLTMAFEPSDLALREVRLERDGVLHLHVELSRLTPYGSVRLPKYVRVQAPQRGEDLSIAHRHVETNPTDLDADTFRPPCPRGTKRFWMGCDGAPPHPLDVP